jgi:hypothetical protein
VRDGRIYIEKINGPFLYQLKGTPAGIQGWASARERERLADPARERDLRSVHRGGRRAVRLKLRPFEQMKDHA